MADKICGRKFEILASKKSVRSRVIVEGVTHIGGTPKHPNTGKPIRFKSIQAAERHIRTMRLEKADA